MKSVPIDRQMKSYTAIREERDEHTNTSFKSGFWFDSFPHGPLFFFLPRFQLFNECLHSACYCLKLCCERQTSLHSSTHYRANALCPHSLPLLTFSDSCLCPCLSNLQSTLSDTFPPFTRVQYFPLSEDVCSSLLTPTFSHAFTPSTLLILISPFFIFTHGHFLLHSYSTFVHSAYKRWIYINIACIS